MIFVIAEERKIDVWHNVHLSARFLLKRWWNGGIDARVEFIFTHGFGQVSEAAFTMFGNPNKVFSTDDSSELTFRVTQSA